MPNRNDRPPRHERGATSSTAARRIRQDTGRLERLVLETLQRAGRRGLTDAEAQQRLNLAGDTQRPRRIDLVHRGLIVDSGCRRVTPRGRFAVVWVVVEHAVVAA